MADINKSRELDEGKANDFGKVTVGPAEYLVEKAKDTEGITVKVDVDVSEALTGLKAVERRAKEATKALREYERAVLDGGMGINDLRDVQGQDGNWDHDEYMCGLFNGLELASATLEGRTPDYREIEGSVKPGLNDDSSSDSRDFYDLSDVPTAELSRALAKREGVTEHILPHPGSHARLNVATVDGGYPVFIEGPATILVNID